MTTETKPEVLTEGEWSAFLFQCPDAVKPLLVRLAVAHGHLQKPRDPRECGPDLRHAFRRRKQPLRHITSRAASQRFGPKTS